ncbi:thymidylate synthase [Ruegeria phage RpAliso]|nr:thymidylate synthase [Ruegeria phage RpAliso]
MTIEAKIIAHSRSCYHASEHLGPVPDLITFQLRYPRFIHAEVMTHRLFSRNASSSRAIPVKRMIQDVIDDPAMPIHWGKNQRGMQAEHEHDAGVPIPFPVHATGLSVVWEDCLHTPKGAWLHARDNAVKVAKSFDAAGYHKQVVNRILEPFTHINVIVTASGFDNFFWLRRHPDAQPEIKALADAMWDALQASTPKVLYPGEWHLPYVTDEDRANYGLSDLIRVSVARCARVSYMTHDGRKPDFEEDRALYERLVGGEPLHASPAEHQAMIDTPSWGEHTAFWDNASKSGNFAPGYIQYRKTLPGEYCGSYTEAA